MTDRDAPTWRNAERDAREAARERYADERRDGGDMEACGDYAHEYAEWSADVIYTHRARTIWADAAEVQAHEDDANAMMTDDASIDRRITVCVYLALVEAYCDEWQTLADDDDDDDACPHCDGGYIPAIGQAARAAGSVIRCDECNGTGSADE